MPASTFWRISPAEGEASRDELAELARGLGLRVVDDDTWSDIFSRIVGERIEPHLGIGRATILTDYPASEAALARRKPSDPRLSERFELYVCGVELANAFGELTDPDEQRRRFEADMAEKQRIYGERYPIDEDFLAALAHHAAGERHCARPRPAGDAGDRRHAHRAGRVDADCGMIAALRSNPWTG